MAIANEPLPNSKISSFWNLPPEQVLQQLKTSGASQLNFRVDRSEFIASIIDFHLPIDSTLGAVDIR